ncbi:MAG: phage terminase large subunit [Victivallaceae bacterium]|nr:phage terminase large subunit [Victivallaceae bacterium]
MNNFKKTDDQRRALAMLGGPARNVLLYGGSRSGKTFITVYALIYRALHAPASRHAILRFRGNSVRQSVLNDTFHKVVKVCFPKLKFKLNRTDMLVELPNRAEIWFGGLDTPERSEKILGREFATIYFNECSEISYDSVLLAQTRLAQRTALRNKSFFDCNPSGTGHWTYLLFVRKVDPASRRAVSAPDGYACMRMNPSGNSANLPKGYIEETLAGLSIRQRRRFLDGEFAAESEGALWTRNEIDLHRTDSVTEDLERVVIGVDPAVTAGSASDLTGIVAVGRGASGHYYVLADRSLSATPLQWAAAVSAACSEFFADCVVGECNQGGDLIEMALRGADAALPFKKVTATRGKFVRAEPVAALYERGIVHHVGNLIKLEEQMCSFVPGRFDGSPDRMDALVWAFTELLNSGGGNRWITA